MRIETGETVKATLLANAGVLLEYRGTRLLIDGIFDKKGHCFSNLSAEQWEGLKAGTGIFSGIDYLLFTHEHGDHFSPERTMEYLGCQKPKALFLPKEGSAALRALHKQAESLKIPCVLLEGQLCRNTVFKPEEGTRIRAFQTRHLDKSFWDVPHFWYLLEFGGKKLFFTADVDFTYETFSALQGVQLDAVFINPLMRHSKEGRRVFSEGMLRTRLSVVYHIPFEGEDAMQVRSIAERERLSGENDEAVIFLMERGQTCFF